MQAHLREQVAPPFQRRDGLPLWVTCSSTSGRARRSERSHSLDVRQLGALGAQELAPRRHVVEQVAHFHRGAVRMRLRHDLAEMRPPRSAVRAMGRIARARASLKRLTEATDGSASPRETERGDRLEVVDAGDLAGRMPAHRQRQLLRHRCRRHRRADADQADAAFLEVDVDAARAASSAFSTSSLTTDAGRSTTSPAAIWLIRVSGSWRIVTRPVYRVASGGFRPAERSALRRRWTPRWRPVPPARSAYSVPGGGWRVK